jgi:uncharacterized membrane protein
MAAAALSLAGLLVSVYLLLYKLGVTGPLVCGAGGGCEQVQASRWAELLGIPVAAYGVAGYLVLLGVSLAGLRAPWIERREPTNWLVILSGIGVAFSLYLTYLELFVIRAICRWCLVSAVLITAVFVVSLLGGMKRQRREA